MESTSDSTGPVNDLNTVLPLMTLSVFDWIALLVVILGGLNWGLVGILNLDLIAAALGIGTAPSRAVYIIVGVAAIYAATLAWRLAALGAARKF